MKRYRSIANFVQAGQWSPGAYVPGVSGEEDFSDGGNGLSPEPARAWVRSGGRRIMVRSGDWVVHHEATGGVEVLSDAEFRRAYEDAAK